MTGLNIDWMEKLTQQIQKLLITLARYALCCDGPEKIKETVISPATAVAFRAESEESTRSPRRGSGLVKSDVTKK